MQFACQISGIVQPIRFLLTEAAMSLESSPLNSLYASDPSGPVG